jgi:hypothetical protein
MAAPFPRVKVLATVFYVRTGLIVRTSRLIISDAGGAQ